MTDNEIIKFMQCVIGNDANCSECEYQKVLPFPSCRMMCAKNALNLINSQKAEIERLQKNIDGLNIFTKNHIKVIRLQAIKEFEEELEYFILNEDVEIVKPKCKYYGSYINGANQFRHQIKNGIKKLVKEMEVSE